MAYQPKSYRKFLAGTVTAAVVASAVTPAAAATTFSDVENLDQETKDAIYALVDAGTITGYPDGTFKPFNDINRGQVAKMIVRHLGLELPEESAGVFADLSADSEFVLYAEALYNAGIISGTPQEDGTRTFGAGLPLTREQMAKILVNALGLEGTGEDVEIKDLNEAAADQREYIQTLAQLGLTSLPNGEFNPKDAVKRSQLALFLHRADQINVELAITEASAVDVDKIKVDFNKVFDAEKADFTLKRGNVVYDAEVTVDEKDKSVAVLKTAVKLPEGDYTVSVAGLSDEALTTSFKVEAEVAKEIKVSTSTVQYQDNAKVSFEVLNQYGTKFRANTSEIVANAYNTTANNDIATTVVTDANGNLSVELDNLVSETVGTSKAHKVGDKVRVTLTYKGITVQSTVEVIDLSGIASLDLKDVSPLKDTARITVGDIGLELPYVLLDQYGKELKLPNHTANQDTNNDVEVLNGIQFTSSNPSVVDVDTFAVTDGKLTFNAGTTAGTARITALIPATGEVSYIDVTVNQAATVENINVVAPSTLVAGNETVKLNFTAVDQYGTTIKPENLTGLVFTSTNQNLVADSGIKIEKGQLVINTKANVTQAGQVTINISNGVKNVGSVSFEVNPDAVISSISSVNVTSLFENTGKDVLTFDDIKVRDQYGRAYALSTETVTIVAKDGDANAVTASLTNDVDTDNTFNSTEDEFTFTGTTVTGTNEVFVLTVGGVSKEFTLASVATSAIDSYVLEAPATLYGTSTNTSASAHAATLTLKGKSANKEVALAANKVTAFTTSNPSVAGVDNSGKTWGLKAGTSTITAYSGATKLAEVTITVSEEVPVATTVSFADASKDLTNGATYTNTLTVKDQYGVVISSPQGTFTSSDSTIASVNATTGEVTASATKDGKVTISYITNNGVLKSYEVTVN
ncbi:MAG TPA: S-layer homology domain-containing protein [Bacillus sp. (in: firmicutes)]|nr:S-layer homology domain-containing protein [Bacillus sp. (in: firmicutes)]